MATPSEPPLAAPGAGLPKPELLIARLLNAVRRWTGSRSSFDARFDKERALVHRLVQACDAESGTRRVLIQRVPGMEDSSRYWSVWMTLDHLRIVNGEIARVIKSLVGETLPEGEASTATVKPSTEAAASVIAEHEAACDTLIEVVRSAPDLKTKLRFPHPWFGPMDAAGWHALAGTHMGIHRVQIERIIKGLPPGQPA